MDFIVSINNATNSVINFPNTRGFPTFLKLGELDIP
jgi:hypothetical protein